MEGSAKYLELLHMAEDHFQQPVDVPESSVEVSPGDEILTLLQTTSIDLKEFEREAACLAPEDGSVGAATSESAGPDSGAEDAELAALDVDMNLVANLLESYSAQAGLAGPTWNILQSMGLTLPENTDLTGPSSRAEQ